MGNSICKNIICKSDEYSPLKYVRNAAQKGYRRCSKCCVYLKYQGIFCPCCGNRMKVSPHNHLARQRYREEKLSN